MAEPVSKKEDAGKGKGGRRFTRILLVTSLALNLAVVGLVGGIALKGWRDGPRLSSVRELGFGFFTSALEEEDRRALRQAFLAQAPDMRAARQAMGQDLVGLLEVIRADSFDPTAFEAVLARGAVRADERRELGVRLIADHLTGMSEQARAAFADRLEEGARRRVKRHADQRERRNGG